MEWVDRNIVDLIQMSRNVFRLPTDQFVIENLTRFV